MKATPHYTYCIGDVHGRFDLLRACLDRIWDHAESSGRMGKIILLGDYIDRGPQSAEVLKLLSEPSQIGFEAEIIALRGNHEDMMLETITKNLEPRWWLMNGGRETLWSFGHDLRALDFGTVDYSVVPSRLVKWLRKLPYIYTDEHRVYVHAGVDPNRTIQDQDKDILTWKCYSPDKQDVGHRGRHVVHGHVQHKNGPLLLQNRTNLDVMSFFTGRMVVGVFNDDVPGGPVDIIEVKEEP